MNEKLIISNIKKLRELKGISRLTIAKKMNMSVSGYSKIERGEIELTVNKFSKIAEIIDHSVYEIMGFDSNNIQIESYEKKPIETNTELDCMKIINQIQSLQEEIKNIKKIQSKQLKYLPKQIKN
jgi:transcriptional regulator with XRE-family HTH domain